MILRLFTRSARGPAKPRQVLSATILGSMLAFVPDYAHHWPFAILVACLLIASGANLVLAALVWLPARFLAAASLSVSFSVGRFLIEGPTRPLFEWLVNAPVLALMGFDTYALSGGVVVAIVFGLLLGVTIVRTLAGLRERIGELESEEQRERARTAAPVRMANLVFGRDWIAPAPASLTRVMVRPLLGVALFGGMLLAVQMAPGPWLKPTLTSGLAELNGATVDLESLDVDLTRGRMTLNSLAMADEKDLDRNLFEATRLEADFSTADLLRGRLAIDTLVAHDARQGTARESRGALVGRPEREEPPVDDEGRKTLDDYLEEARAWRERLDQVQDWLEKLGGPEEPVDEESPEERGRRIEQEAREQGYGLVVAEGLRSGAPTFLVSKLEIHGMTSEDLEGDVLDVDAHNLSTEPRLVAGAPRVSIRSRSGDLHFEVGLGGYSGGDTENGIDFGWKGLATNRLLDAVKVADEQLVQGGTIDVELAGAWQGGDVGRIDLPLVVTVRNASWVLGGNEPVALEAVSFPFGLKGSLDDPRIEVEEDALRGTLLAAAERELKGRLGAEAREELDQLLDKGEEALGGELDPAVKDKAKGLLDSILGGD